MIKEFFVWSELTNQVPNAEPEPVDSEHECVIRQTQSKLGELKADGESLQMSNTNFRYLTPPNVTKKTSPS